MRRSSGVASTGRARRSRAGTGIGASEHVQAPMIGIPEHVQAPEHRAAQAMRQAARRTVRTASTPAVGAGCVGSLVRWVILFAIVSYEYTTIGSLPEVREALRALGRGEQVDLMPAANAIRSLVGLPPSEPAEKPASTPRTPSPEAPTREAERPSNGRPNRRCTNRRRSVSLRRRSLPAFRRVTRLKPCARAYKGPSSCAASSNRMEAFVGDSHTVDRHSVWTGR